MNIGDGVDVRWVEWLLMRWCSGRDHGLVRPPRWIVDINEIKVNDELGLRVKGNNNIIGEERWW